MELFEKEDATNANPNYCACDTVDVFIAFLWIGPENENQSATGVTRGYQRLVCVDSSSRIKSTRW